MSCAIAEHIQLKGAGIMVIWLLSIGAGVEQVLLCTALQRWSPFHCLLLLTVTLQRVVGCTGVMEYELLLLLP